MVAWCEFLLGVKVPKVKVKGYQLVRVERPEDIKQHLEEAMS